MLKANHTTGLVFFPAYDWAISASHPEREERLLYTQDQILEEGLLDIAGITELKPDLVTGDDVRRVHFCVPDPRGVMTQSHFISAGGAKTIGTAIMENQIERGFALVRPPGHHAMRVVHGGRGFCAVNIEAIMIEYLRQAYQVDKVAIIDTDCHHGDGTQDIYWYDPDTLFISIHQDGRTLYPGSGATGEMGGGSAIGTTLNIPLPPQTSAEGFLYAVEHIVLPILADFKPDLIVNSAGQDNHYSDPITNMNFCAQGYADLTALLKPDIAVLEGGYSIEGALPYVNLGIVLAMAGMDYSHVREPDYDPDRIQQNPDITAYIEKVGETVLGLWQQRTRMRETMCSGRDYLVRDRNIFYDTDQIMEKQQDRITICPDCNGALRIDSEAGNSSRITAIHIPRKACPRCQERGHQWYAGLDTYSCDRAYLQDRVADQFLEKKLRPGIGDRF